MGLSAFKKVAKKKKTTKKKDEKPEVKVSGPLVNAHTKWLEGKKKEKDGKAAIKKNEGLLLPFAMKEHQKACQQVDKYYSSIKLIREDEGGKEHSLTVSFTNKYSEIPCENEESLREIYGEEEYERFFREETKVALSAAALADDSFTDKLVEIVGEENFERYFDVKTYIKPIPEYHESRMRNPELAEKHQQAVDDDLIRCNKPSIKQ